MRLVVIGGVAAGLSAAARARRIDRSIEILVLEKGETISYGACGLPYYIEGRVPQAADLIVYTPEYFKRERNIDVRTRAPVVSIAHPRREVVVDGGERIRYDKLVIATGAKVRRTAIPGSNLPHVFCLHTFDDALRLRQFLDERRPRSAAVIGAGYIGLESADALRRRGLSVTVFEQSRHVLHREDDELTARVSAHLQRFRIELRCGARVESIEPDHTGGVPCDLVILAAGIAPNTELAIEAGVELGITGAIRVTDRMETNLGAVYAAGDCAETTHLVSARPAYIPLGTTANKMGRVAGANAAGRRERFPGVAGTSIVAVCGLGIATTGLSAAEARRDGFSPVSARIEARAQARYFGGTKTTIELIADRTSRRLLGGVVTGEQGVAGRINVIASALLTRMRVDDFEQLDLAYAPPYAPVWDPLLVAAQQLLKLLD
jgi:CoA-dependent NAD(P)H sulfur oxidoreductase